MFEISFDQWTIAVEVGQLPENYSHYIRHAAVVDELDLSGSGGEFCFVGVYRSSGSKTTDVGWPEIVIAQRYESFQSTCRPGAIVVPETSVLFIGAGTRLLAYDLSKLARLWEDYTEFGFSCWRQHGKTVLMSAELEFAAWSDSGEKLWSTFVEPSWNYVVAGEQVELDVMGKKSRFEISVGPNGNLTERPG